MINQKGARLCARQGRLVIQYPDDSGKQPSSISLQRLKQVVVTACVELDSAVLHLLSGKGIHLSFYSPRSPVPVILLSEPDGNVVKRMGQYRAVCEETLATRMARALVRRKLMQQWFWLCQQGLRENAITVKQLMEKISTAKRPALLGLEGSAARTVYQSMASILPDEWQFTGRSRRPPRDPVNAMLSFGSSLIYQQAVQALMRQRLDVFAGFYHQPCAGRASLAWDMVELFRPALEAFIIELLHKGHIRPSHFTVPTRVDPVSEGCRFTSQGLGVWFHQWLPLSRITERRMEKLSLKWAQTALQYGMG